MDVLPRTVLQEIVTRHEAPCVSIYMPTEHVESQVRQNPTRFKNLVRQVKERLQDSDLSTSEIDTLLEPARELINNRPYWREQDEGLAAYFAPDWFQTYRFPYQFEELAVVNDRFYIKPLLPMMSNDGRFYVLALSKNSLRLLRGTHYSVGELQLDNVPQSLAEALSYDDAERQLQFHTETQQGGPGSNRSAVFHGQGFTDGSREKKDILRYFQQVDQGIHELLREEEVPLILAGVEYLLPIYKEANTYTHLLDEGIPGNPERMSDEDLHDRAWQIVEPIFREREENALTQYRELAGQGERTAQAVEDIVPAAYFQRVDTLFVAMDQHIWGEFDPDTSSVTLHDESSFGNEDLLDLAAVHTYLNGGDIYPVAQEDMPGKAPIAAIYRY